MTEAYIKAVTWYIL